MITISANSPILNELRNAVNIGVVAEIAKTVDKLVAEKNEDIASFNNESTPLGASLKENCIGGLNEVKDALKEINKDLKKAESQLTARRFKILQWASKNAVLYSYEEMMDTKFRRVIAREINVLMSSDFSTREKFAKNEKPESMLTIDLLSLTIEQMCRRICNVSATNASIQRELDKVVEIMNKWEQKNCDDSGKLALIQLREIMEAEPFTDKHNPNFPVLTKSL